jgi:hypothetical protein
MTAGSEETFVTLTPSQRIEATTAAEGRAKVRIEKEIHPSPRGQPLALRDAAAGYAGQPIEC